MITVLSRHEVNTSLSGTALVTALGGSQALITTLSIPGSQGPKGDPGDAFVTQTHSAGEILSGHRAVRVVSGLAFYCDGATASQAGRAIGITTGAAIVNDTVTVQTAGLLTEPSWGWTPGPVFVGLDGTLTQSLVGLAFIHQIGLAVSPTAIDINPLSPILIS